MLNSIKYSNLLVGIGGFYQAIINNPKYERTLPEYSIYFALNSLFISVMIYLKNNLSHRH